MHVSIITEKKVKTSNINVREAFDTHFSVKSDFEEALHTKAQLCIITIFCVIMLFEMTLLLRSYISYQRKWYLNMFIANFNVNFVNM